MRKNGTEKENENCKMFNEQIFEIFPQPLFLLLPILPKNNDQSQRGWKNYF